MKKSILTGFQKWEPFENLDRSYSIFNIDCCSDDVTLLLTPDYTKREDKLFHQLRLHWNEVLLFQIMQRSLREDCRLSDPKKEWTFYKGAETDRLLKLKKENPLIPEETKHYMILGFNQVADIFSASDPEVILKPTDRERFSFRKIAEYLTVGHGIEFSYMNASYSIIRQNGYWNFSHEMQAPCTERICSIRETDTLIKALQQSGIGGISFSEIFNNGLYDIDSVQIR